MQRQIIPAREREPSFSEKLSQGVGRGLQEGSRLYGEHKENKLLKELTGLDFEGIQDPELRSKAFQYAMQNQGKASQNSKKLEGNKAIITDLESRRGLEPGSLAAYEDNPAMAERVSKPEKTQGGVTAQEVPKQISSKINKVLKENPNASSDDLSLAMDEAGIPTIYSNRYTENRRRTEEYQTKSAEDKNRALRQETLPIRKEIADKATAARQGIQNKDHLLDLIKNGDIDDPTYAALAEALPLNLGKRLLSNDTVEYKSGLIDEYKDLRNIFKGQTRIKEIELLEQKIADLYLTDDQKEAILNSRIKALQADVIRGEVAAELENEPYGVLQFNEELEKRVKPRLEALFNRILDEQKSIIQDAENKKKIPLDPQDPEDYKIMIQIKKEANGDKAKAKEIAKKRGYIVKGSS